MGVTKRRPSEGADQGDGVRKPVLSILERNIESFPTFALTGRGGDTIEFVADEVCWRVENRPGPGARDAYVALCHLYNDARRPESRRVYATLPQLARVMGVAKGGKQWALLAGYVEELKDAKITAVRAFNRGGMRVSRVTFGLVDKVQITSPVEGDGRETTLVVTFSEDVVSSIADGYYRLMDTDAYFALGSPVAKSLFSILDAKRYQGKSRTARVSIGLATLRERLALAVKAPSQVKRALVDAHADLISQGFLGAVEYVPSGVPGRGLDAWTVRYSFAETQGNLRLVPGMDDEETRRASLLREVVETMGDPHSTAFYARVVAALSEAQVRGILGATREALQGGLSIDAARKIFTVTAQQRAKDSGAAL